MTPLPATFFMAKTFFTFEIRSSNEQVEKRSENQVWGCSTVEWRVIRFMSIRNDKFLMMFTKDYL